MLFNKGEMGGALASTTTTVAGYRDRSSDETTATLISCHRVAIIVMVSHTLHLRDPGSSLSPALKKLFSSPAGY